MTFTPLKKIATFRVLAWSLLVVAGALTAIDVIPRSQAYEVWIRVWPILAFLLLIKLASDLLDECGVFFLLAAILARLCRGRTWLLFLSFGLICIACTAILSLDATVVLMTPIAIAIAKRIKTSPLPLLFATVWIANIGSMFLPVSNLTNLLAQQTQGWTPMQFIKQLLPTQIVLLLILLVALAIIFRAALGESYTRYSARRLSRYDVRPLALLGVTAIILSGYTIAVVFDVAPWLAALVLVFILIGMFFLTSTQLRATPDGKVTHRNLTQLLRAMPWDMAAFALGLFVLIDPISQWLAGLFPAATGLGASATVGVAGVVLANLVNNLPAYLALEPAAGANITMLLVGVNAGPIITPWASLANLLWLRMCAEREIKIPIGRFVTYGLILVPLMILSALAVVHITA